MLNKPSFLHLCPNNIERKNKRKFGLFLLRTLYLQVLNKLQFSNTVQFSFSSSKWPLSFPPFQQVVASPCSEIASVAQSPADRQQLALCCTIALTDSLHSLSLRLPQQLEHHMAPEGDVKVWSKTRDTAVVWILPKEMPKYFKVSHDPILILHSFTLIIHCPL